MVNKGRFQGGKGGQARRDSLKRSRRKHERVSGAKALQDDLKSLGFNPSQAKPEIEK